MRMKKIRMKEMEKRTTRTYKYGEFIYKGLKLLEIRIWIKDKENLHQNRRRRQCWDTLVYRKTDIV